MTSFMTLAASFATVFANTPNAVWPFFFGGGSPTVVCVGVAADGRVASVAPILLYESGITADALAAVGATDDQVRTICLAAQLLCEARTPSYESLLESCEDSASVEQDLCDKVMSVRACAAERQALPAAREALAAHRRALAAYGAELRAMVDATLTQAQRQGLTNIAAARHQEVPVAFKVVARTDAEWVGVRDAVAIAAERGEEFEGAESDVAAARVLHAARGEGVAEAWRGVVGW